METPQGDLIVIIINKSSLQCILGSVTGTSKDIFKCRLFDTSIESNLDNDVCKVKSRRETLF